MSTEETGIATPALERIDPATSCIVVIDVQNDFCSPGGWSDRQGLSLGAIQGAVDNIVEFLRVGRSVGMMIAFVRAIYDEVFLSAPMLEQKKRAGFKVEHCQSGSWGADFYKVRPAPRDVVITKHRYSAFVDTELNALLRARKTENLILTGVNTNVCVESTARDAFMLDYHVVFMSDCTATYDKAAHNATLLNIERAFGIVTDIRRVIETWREAGLSGVEGVAGSTLATSG